MFFNPGNISIHPILQELFAIRTSLASLIKQTFLGMNERFRLAKYFGSFRHLKAEAGKNLRYLIPYQCDRMLGPERSATAPKE